VSTPYERLLAETIPTRPTPADPRPAWTAAQQAQHWADLCEAIADWRWEGDTSLSAKRRHLRLLRQTDAA
jgi:hypothetical protein